MTPLQIGICLAQLLTTETIDKFREEVQNSPLSQNIKELVLKEFYQGCKIKEKVKYLMNYHREEIRYIGFAFDWVLRNNELK